MRGNQVFGERSRAPSSIITASSSGDKILHSDNFFPEDLDTFFGNLNMGDNTDAANAAAAATANAVKYVIYSSLFSFF